MSAKHEFQVEMTCGGCSKAVNTVLSKVPGVTKVDISLETQRVVVEGTASKDACSDAIKKTGKKFAFVASQ